MRLSLSGVSGAREDKYMISVHTLRESHRFGLLEPFLRALLWQGCRQWCILRPSWAAKDPWDRDRMKT
jgi:hypothetical protein